MEQVEARFFKDKKLQHQFEQDGFVKVRLLSTEQAQRLLAIYSEVSAEQRNSGAGYHTTSQTGNLILLKKVQAGIGPVLQQAAAQYLDKIKPIMVNFLVKEPNENSNTVYHQDLTVVDESKYYSFNIWVALQDTDEKNGCMRFIPGSHRLMQTLRIAPTYPWVFAGITNQLDKFAVSFPTKAGEGFIFSHSVIHSSPPNKSGSPRVAAVLGAYSADADLRYYYLPEGKPQNEIEEYEMSVEAFMNLGHHGRPSSGKFIKYVSANFSQMEAGEFRKRMCQILGWKQYWGYTLKKLIS